MAKVMVGSARHNEFGGISGGVPGDQTGHECEIQEWYKHDLGWVVIRAKSEAVREKIAQDMEYICANDNIGYDQPRDQSLYKASKPYGFNASLVTSKCDTDCARAVRVCVLYAGIDCPDFYTATEARVLSGTGEFDLLTDSRYTDSPDYLLRGDILVTKTKGHTVVVLSDGDMAHRGGELSGYTATGNVYQRNGPGTNYPAIAIVKKGETVNGSTISGNWLQCEYKGKWGYCSLKYLKASGTAAAFAALTGNAYMRETPGITGKALCVIRKGESVTLTGATQKVLLTAWHKVRYDGKTGWVSGKYLKM